VGPGPGAQLSLLPENVGQIAVAAGVGKKRPRECGGADYVLALPNGNVLPYKRAAAADKSGLPVYQPAPVQPAAPPPAYQHSLLQIQQQSFVPVTYHSGQPIAIPRYQWLHSKLVILAVKTDFVQDECCSVASTSGLMMAVVQPCIVIHTGDLNKLYSSRSPKHLKTSGTHSSLDTFCRKERIHIRFGKSYPTYS